MARKYPYDDVLKQIAADQQQAAAERQRQEQQQKRDAINQHFDTLQFLLAVKNANEDAALRSRFGGIGPTGL